MQEVNGGGDKELSQTQIFQQQCQEDKQDTRIEYTAKLSSSTKTMAMIHKHAKHTECDDKYGANGELQSAKVD